MPLIRYPGSKEKLYAQIANHFPDAMRYPLWSNAAKWEYREPFFGCGAIGFRLLKHVHAKSKIWLNDKDYWLVCLWNAVLDSPSELISQINDFEPSAESFYQFKEQDGTKDIDPCLAGFRKLALHQMSYSGFGYKSGGPLGGQDQSNAKYPVGCRWNPVSLKTQVSDLHELLNRFERLQITCRDFSEVLKGCPKECFVYIDPPYVEKGNALYKHGMTEKDHQRLAKAVSSLRCHWALSYDDHPLVRDLYAKFNLIEVDVVYTNAKAEANRRRPKNKELVITP
jgi:DNA adenine methylase